MDPGAVALEKLACTPHHALLSKAPNGQRGLVALYRDCRVAGLLLPSGVQEYELDDIKRMKALFDVALANGMGCLVVDYVHEVIYHPAPPAHTLLIDPNRYVPNPSGQASLPCLLLPCPPTEPSPLWPSAGVPRRVQVCLQRTAGEGTHGD